MANNGATYFKYSSLLVIVLATLWFFRDCNHTGAINPTKTDTVSIKIDTGHIVYKHDTSYVPRFYKIVYRDTTNLHDTLLEKVDTAAIMHDYYATKYYRDTAKVQYGYVVIEDTVLQNRLDGQSVHTHLTIPEITKTVVLSQPKRNVVFFGMGAYTDKSWTLAATSASVAMKFKNDKIVSLNGMLFKGGNVGWGGSFYFPIKLHK